MKKKSACVILMTILLLVLIPLSAAIVYHPGLVRDAFPTEQSGCINELNNCGRDINCVKDKNKICENNPYVTIVCKEGNVSIGGSIDTCTINESQIIFSGNYLLVYNFTNFMIEKGPLKYKDIELRVVSLSTLFADEGSAKGGNTTKGKFNQSGGRGGKGATLTSFAYAGTKGNDSDKKGGEGGYGGGSIIIYAKNFTNYGRLNANGVVGEAGSGCEGCQGSGGGGGGGGGLVVINADYFDNQGTISAEGGVGGLGGEEYGGGGGGGDGGTIHLNVKEIKNEGNLFVDGGPGGCSAWNLTEEGEKENIFCGAQGGYENWLIKTFWFARKEEEIKKDGEKGKCLAEEGKWRGWAVLDSCARIEFNICDPTRNVPEGEPKCEKTKGNMNHSIALRTYECVSHKMWHKGYNCLGAAAPESGDFDAPTIGEEEPGQNGADGTIIEANCIYKAYNGSILLKNNGDFWCDYFSNYNIEEGGDKVGTLHMLFWCNDGKIAASQLSNRAHICKDGEFELNLFSQCFQLSSENCANNWQCRKINDKCVPKYPSAEADCSYGNSIIKGNGECTLNSSTYFQPYKECVRASLGNNDLNPSKAICSSVGDCGNNSHFSEEVSLGEGYDIIPLDNSSALFKCEKVELKPQTEDTCSTCNEEPLSEYGRCTDYVCSSLGSDCKYNSETKQCEKTYSGIEPYLTDIGVSAEGYECKIEKEVVEGKVLPSITLSCATAGECILPYSKLKLTYSTNNDTICKIAIYPKGQSLSASWENMSNADNNANFFTTQHVWDIPAYFFPKLDQDVSAHAYLVCKNRYGKSKTYEINFCVSGTDNIPPAIETSYVDREEVAPGPQSMKIYVNEPVENCTVTLSSGGQLLLNKNNFSYSREGKIVAEFSFDMPTQDLSIQIQCEDESGNVGGKSLTLIPAVRGISLAIESPQDNSIFTTCYDEVEINYALSVDTACNLVGCSLKACNTTSCKTFSLGQELQGKIKLGNGSYVLNFSCSDSCNFEASQNVSISVNVDKEGPHVKRLYKEGGNLVIITDKKASCYELARCRDVTQNELIFISPFSQNAINHLLPWRLAPYYAWCQDECGDGECNIINPL
ncbi:MAG: hypothetical protein QW199_01965 [Candidatus Pacearchaeota archaeon]